MTDAGLSNGPMSTQTEPMDHREIQSAAFRFAKQGLRWLHRGVLGALVGFMVASAAAAPSTSTSASASASESTVAGPSAPLAEASAASLQPVPRKTLGEVAGQLRGKGHVYMMRHAQTEPGMGDPENFRIGDCSTQRNLAESGRQQAARIGQMFREAGIVFDRVRSSQWCRCRETARLAFGADEEWPVLNSSFRNRSEQPARSREISDYARQLNPQHNIMLVTHQLTITPLVGGWVDSAEIVVFRHDGQRLVPLYRITPPQDRT